MITLRVCNTRYNSVTHPCTFYFTISGTDIQNSVFYDSREEKFGMLCHYVIKSVVSFTLLPS